MLNIITKLFETGLLNKKNKIRLYYSRCVRGKNFGDALGPYIVEKITTKKIQPTNKYSIREYYLSVGSILGGANKNAIIWGSGILYKNQIIKKPKKILAIRGPKTRERLLELGFECPEIYGDPALLLPKFYQPKSIKNFDLGVIPHYVDYEETLFKFKNINNVKIINLLDPIEKVVDDIFSCNKTISSSLHGIIVSHAYNIPSMWVEFSKKLAGDGVKFEDYFLSVNIKPYKPLDYSGEIPKIKDVVDFLDKNHNFQININLEKLMQVCPFKSN